MVTVVLVKATTSRTTWKGYEDKEGVEAVAAEIQSNLEGNGADKVEVVSAGSIVDLARRIRALATNPHWSADRRWKIGEYAEQIEALILR